MTILNKTYKQQMYLYIVAWKPPSLRQNINTGYEKYIILNFIDVKISATFGATKIIDVICGYGKSAPSSVYKLLLSTCINKTKPNGQIPQSKLDQRRRVQSH